MVFPVHLQQIQTNSVGAKYTLTVHFDDTITCEGRFMNCGGGWVSRTIPYTLGYLCAYVVINEECSTGLGTVL